MGSSDRGTGNQLVKIATCMTSARKIRPGQRRRSRARLPGRPPEIKPAANPTRIAISRNIEGLPSATGCTAGACGVGRARPFDRPLRAQLPPFCWVTLIYVWLLAEPQATEMGHWPGVVRVPTIQVQATFPLASEVLGTKP